MKIPLVNKIKFDGYCSSDIVGSLDVTEDVGQAIAAAYRSGQIVSLDGVVCFRGSTVSMMHLAIRIEGTRAESKLGPPKIAMTIEPIGCEPRLKVGDVVKVDDTIGVVIHAFMHPNSPPNYDIAFGKQVGLKRTGWKITEIDEVVSLGPFH
jgi:hypothetical protein